MTDADLMPKGMSMPDAFSYQAGQAAAADLLKFIGKDGTLLSWESAALGFLGGYLTTVAATLGNPAAEGSQARIIKSLERPMRIQRSARN